MVNIPPRAEKYKSKDSEFINLKRKVPLESPLH